MSYKIIIQSKSGLRVHRLGENLWQAQAKSHDLFTTPKIQFSLGSENQIQIRKYDLMRPSLIYSILFASIVLICEFVFKQSFGRELITYLIAGGTIFHFGLMALMIYIAKVRIQNQLDKKTFANNRLS